MPEHAPKFRREPEERRRETLIQATLALIAEAGVRGATVRAIATRAGVTPGLIRHYFGTRETLISEAYADHMSHMTGLTAAPRAPADAPARTRLRVFVAAGLEPPVADPRAVSLWAGFLNKVRSDTRMREIHEQTYHDFRDRLEALIAEVLDEARIAASPRRLRRLAIACNAVIDGLWMEGGALPSAFEPGELSGIGVKSVGALIGVDLEATGDTA